MLTNAFGGLQGIVDHVLVGNLVGYQANAAIGVSWQIFLVVIAFISSLFTGMSVLVARFAGAGEADKVDRVVYQAFLTAIGISLGILAPVGYVVAPWLLNLVNAAPAVQAEALPYLRIMFGFSSGMMIFFMLSGALRAAGDARTPMILGIAMTVLNLLLNIVLIRGLGPISAFGTRGSAMGTCITAGLLACYAIWKLWRGGWVVSFPRGRGLGPIPAFGTRGSAMGTCITAGLLAVYALSRLWSGRWVVRFPRGRGWGPDWTIIRELFRFGLPTGIQGIAMNIGGVLMLSFIGSLAQSAAAQAAFAVSYTELFALITWTSVGLMGSAAAVAGQNLGAGHPDRAEQAVHIAARYGLAVAAFVGLFFLFFPRQLLAIFGMHDAVVVDVGIQLLRVLSVSGLFITVALSYTGGLQGTGDTKSPLYISMISQILVPLGICFVIQQTGKLDPIDIWLAILAGHVTRCVLSVLRFRQGKWRTIAVRL